MVFNFKMHYSESIRGHEIHIFFLKKWYPINVTINTLNYINKHSIVINIVTKIQKIYIERVKIIDPVSGEPDYPVDSSFFAKHGIK